MRNKKKGFTLIELLAVIVILAIIALIAIPQILGVIEKSRKGAAEVSALGYMDAVEKYMIMHDIDQGKYPYDLKNKTLNIESSTTIPTANGSITIEALNTIIEVKGSKPTSGTVTIDNKEVTSATLVVNGYNVTCTGKSCSASGKSNDNTSNNNNSNPTPSVTNYTVSYNANGGSGEMASTTNSVATNTFTRTNYVFVEWNTKADGTGTTYTTSSSVSSDLTLYAIWEYNVPTIATCPGCQFLYTTSDLTIGTSTAPEGVTNDYTTLNKNKFLGIITNSTTGVIERAFACGVEGTTAFCLEGKDTSKYASNIDIMNTIYPSCNASSSASIANCNGSSVNATARSNGDAIVYGGNGSCNVSFDGTVDCH